MSQSLYDALHGMAPEELWSRYHEYPWLDKNNNMVMQSEPEYYRGPMLPSDAKQVSMPQGRMGEYLPRPIDKILLNKDASRSEQLSSLNHELQHRTQQKQGLNLTDDSYAYSARATEAQGRLASLYSHYPESLKQFLNPYAVMNNNESLEALSSSAPPPADAPPEVLAAWGKAISDRLKSSEDFWKERVYGKSLSLMELLQQGREPYYPPFISQEMQRAR